MPTNEHFQEHKANIIILNKTNNNIIDKQQQQQAQIYYAINDNVTIDFVSDDKTRNSLSILL